MIYMIRARLCVCVVDQEMKIFPRSQSHFFDRVVYFFFPCTIHSYFYFILCKNVYLRRESINIFDCFSGNFFYLFIIY